MIKAKRISRRTFLRGVGVAMALPHLDIMTPLSANTSLEIPKRLVFISHPYGVTEETWFPKCPSGKLILSEGLKALQKNINDISVLSNLSNRYTPNSVHSGCTTFLTCANLRSNPKSSFTNTVSVDQVAAQELGKNTRYESLELIAGKEGGMGPGLSLAWDQQGDPLPAIREPSEIFNHLFGEGDGSVQEQHAKLTRRQSILDVIREDTLSLKRIMSRSDSDRVDEYFTTIRQLEKRMEKEAIWIDKEKPNAPIGEPSGRIKGQEGVKLFFDMMVAALQTDSTRVISYIQPLASLIKELGSSLGTHQVSHYKGFSDRLAVSQKKDNLQAELLGYFLDKLAAIKEADGSRLLDNCFIAQGCGIRAVHTQKDFPIIIAGGKAMGVKQGQHQVYESGETPLANLWLTMLNASGVETSKFADSSSPLTEIRK